MATSLVSIDTQHDDMIHDTQFDYYAKRLATCSSDRTIKIFDVAGERFYNSATLNGHEGPVWQIAWAHPKFGTLLASCSYDGREESQNVWSIVYQHKFHESSVNSIAWAPHEYGLILACASSDGRISVLEYKGDAWTVQYFQNDMLGSNAVSWAPANSIGSQKEDGSIVKRLVTGSCDNGTRIWKHTVQSGWQEDSLKGPGHTDWVRDVAWAPTTAMPFNMIATCSEDCSVLIWRQSEDGSPWTPTLMRTFEAPVWRVSWSITGNVLAVSTGDHKVTLWKQSVDESWTQISSIEE